MELFGKRKRDRHSPMRQGERLFRFYNSSAWESVSRIRDVLNKWIANFNEKDQADLVGRMRSKSDAQFKAAFTEVALHEALLASEYAIETHPDLPNGRRPDFKIRDKDKKTIGYLEVTSFGPSRSAEAAANRKATIYNAIDKAKIPENCFLTFAVERAGAKDARIRQLTSEIEKWVTENKDKIGQGPKKIFKSNGWAIELTLHVLPTKRTDPRNIGIHFGGVGWISAPHEIRKALDEKSKAYGDLDAPFLIAVADCKGELSGGSNERDLIAALFGDEVVHFRTRDDGTYDSWDGREDNGFWGSADKPKNRNVAGVILFPNPDVWALGAEKWQPILIRNPWANTPIGEDVIPITRLSLQEDKFDVKKANFAKLVKLPEGWPEK
jgi:hypothetical protein